VCEVRPALDFESLIETVFTLVAEGRTNRTGMPNPLRLAVIATAHFDRIGSLVWCLDTETFGS